jgi:DNA adenine methylase
MALFEENGLADGHYVEPYAGGAGIALALLFSEYASRVHINDLSPSVFAFWHSVLHETEALTRLIHDRPVSLPEWGRQRAVQAEVEKHSLLDVGFSTFFLNRTNRSGILRAGVIGGREQRSEWGIGARFNKPELIGRIEKIARYRDRISLTNLDAGHFIRTVLPKIPLRSLVFADPPYFVQGGRLYESAYEPGDHAEIARLIQTTVRQPWLVSYDNQSAIRRLYAGRRQMRYDLAYSASSHYQGTEVIIFSDVLRLPRFAALDLPISLAGPCRRQAPTLGSAAAL